MFVCCILSFIFKSYFLSLLLLIAALVMLFARLWSMQAVKKLTFSVNMISAGVFPDESARFRIKIRNDKFLPVMCAEIYFPLSEDLCLLPETCRQTEENEKADLKELGASTEMVAEKRLPTLLWYETQTVNSVWTARRRGVYSTAGWKLRAGDGFGLSQMELPAAENERKQIAVYPKRTAVNTDMFMRMAWSADTGIRGIMEDNTVIRSSREYQPGDPVKHINWRLTARGLPLTVNLYEEILPQSVYFIFDGESFSGTEKHTEEMEDALSILSSVIISLEGRVRAGISFSEDGKNRRRNVPADASLDEKLGAFAAYVPKPEQRNEDNQIVDTEPVFDAEEIRREAQRTGWFYYVLYAAEKLAGRLLPAALDQGRMTVLSYLDRKPSGDAETKCLLDLKEGGTE